MHLPFASRLLKWHLKAPSRGMPWKGERRPYRIWLSEIMLQQTRVDQAIGYYRRFLRAFPTVKSLANAPEQQVFKLWEGLGYYSRCRNLIHTAREISHLRGGRFPRTYEELLKLRGVGPYTAAAIASFAYGERRAVVDGNVIRVLARYFGLDMPVDEPAGKQLIAQLADELIRKVDPAQFNQAIMDFGATVCLPKQPLCLRCVQSRECQAFRTGTVHRLPWKKARPRQESRWFHYAVLRYRDGVYIRERTGDDIWRHLYEFALWEADDPTMEPPVQWLQELTGGIPFRIGRIFDPVRQQLTHQLIHGSGREILLSAPLRDRSFRRVRLGQLDRFPFPRLLRDMLSGVFPAFDPGPLND